MSQVLVPSPQGSPSASDLEVLVGHLDGTSDFDFLVLGILDDLVGDLFDAGQLSATDGDSEPLSILVHFLTLLLDVSHCGDINIVFGGIKLELIDRILGSALRATL